MPAAFTARAALVADQRAHPPLGSHWARTPAGPIRAGATGSGDDLLVLGWSEADLAAERAAGARVLGALGITPGTPVANMLPGALATPGALLVGDVVEEIGALDVPLGVIESAAAARPAWELFDRVKPAVLILDEGGGAAFLGAAPAADRPWWNGIIWLRRAGAAPRERVFVPEAAGFRGAQRSWLAVPEVASFVAWSCGEGRYHVDAGVEAEVTDGELVLTARGRTAGVARYRSGVRVGTLGASCGCGGSGPVVSLAG
jgi:hypothetical protein